MYNIIDITTTIMLLPDSKVVHYSHYLLSNFAVISQAIAMSAS